MNYGLLYTVNYILDNTGFAGVKKAFKSLYFVYKNKEDFGFSVFFFAA
jgi:hypothetical protein